MNLAPRRQDAATTKRVVACVAFGLALRLAFALLYWVGQPLTHDEREYLALARSVARGEGFQYPADEPSPGTAQQFGRARTGGAACDCGDQPDPEGADAPLRHLDPPRRVMDWRRCGDRREEQRVARRAAELLRRAG